jgi:hypothetical protein
LPVIALKKCYNFYGRWGEWIALVDIYFYPPVVMSTLLARLEFQVRSKSVFLLSKGKREEELSK